jgi:hypothetical protein
MCVCGRDGCAAGDVSVSSACGVACHNMIPKIIIVYNGSMGKLVNPFASHAKDPQFEPGWNQSICFALFGHSQNTANRLLIFGSFWPQLESDAQQGLLVIFLVSCHCEQPASVEISIKLVVCLSVCLCLVTTSPPDSDAQARPRRPHPSGQAP